MYTAYTCSFFILPKPFLHMYVYNVYVPLMYIALNVHIVGDLKSFFTDVVLPRTSGSPSLRTKRTGSTGSNKGSRARSQSERHYPPDHREDCEPITTCCCVYLSVCVLPLLGNSLSLSLSVHCRWGGRSDGHIRPSGQRDNATAEVWKAPRWTKHRSRSVGIAQSLIMRFIIYNCCIVVWEG